MDLFTLDNTISPMSSMPLKPPLNAKVMTPSTLNKLNQNEGETKHHYQDTSVNTPEEFDLIYQRNPLVEQQCMELEN